LKLLSASVIALAILFQTGCTLEPVAQADVDQARAYAASTIVTLDPAPADPQPAELPPALPADWTPPADAVTFADELLAPPVDVDLGGPPLDRCGLEEPVCRVPIVETGAPCAPCAPVRTVHRSPITDHRQLIRGPPVRNAGRVLSRARPLRRVVGFFQRVRPLRRAVGWLWR
jgi:hypothetical protein